MGDVAVESLTDYHVKEGTSTCPAAEQEEDSMEDRTHLDKHTGKINILYLIKIFLCYQNIIMSQLQATSINVGCLLFLV